MKLKSMICLIIAVLFIAWYAPPVRASDYPAYVYLPEDPDKQDEEEAGLENYVNAWWKHRYDQWIPWWLEEGIAPDALEAIDKWKILVPNLLWNPDMNPTEGNSNFRVYYRPCPDDNEAPSCYDVFVWFPLPNGEQANYINAAAVYINNDPSFQWPGSARKAAIAREMGKFYGLHERNLTSLDACNPDELTIMDMLQQVQVGENWEVTHCDGIDGPTPLDKWRVDAFWSGGAPLHADLPVAAWGNGSVATYRWKDLAWAEDYQYLDFQYQNTSGNWVTYVSTIQYFAYIGTHMYTQDRDMAIEVDITQFPVPSGTTWHRACGWAYFAAYNKYGNGQCSLPVSLSRP